MHAWLIAFLVFFGQAQEAAKEISVSQESGIKEIKLEREDRVRVSSVVGFMEFDLKSSKKTLLVRVDALYFVESAPSNRKYENHKLCFSPPGTEKDLVILIPANYVTWDRLVNVLKASQGGNIVGQQNKSIK